ncbi:MAG: PA14 domain-containing protein [Candidatus Brocadiaceae bacterium]|nr:PA14 domain-containing protein [Candidatus Brocadiaceae bacterium]
MSLFLYFMAFVFLFIIISLIAGFLITYYLSARYSLFERTAYGMVIGLGLHTWIAYLFSFLWGLQSKSLYATLTLSVVFCATFTLFHWILLKENVLSEIRTIKNDFLVNKVSYFIHIAIFSFFSTIFCRLFYRTIIWKKDGIYAGLGNNFGDLPLHLAYITSFAWGNNIPPQNPIFAGDKLTYPILSDFLSAIFLKLGLNFRDMLFIPGFLLTVCFYCILYYFTYRVTKRRLSAIIATFLFFFSGGFGFFYFFQDIANSSQSLWAFLNHLPRNYTKIEPLNYHWITPLTCLNVPQRSFLFGFPITLLIFSLLYTGIEQKNYREFLFAGILAGTLPFFHAHSFLAIIVVIVPLGLLFWNWRKWFLFLMPAFILSVPQVLYLTGHVEGGGFFKLHFGWMSGKENFLWFWLKNTGIFWFVVIGGFVMIFYFRKGTFQSGLYALPFLLLFLLPNLILFAPWKWDNIKIFIYWFLGMIPVTAFGLTLLYETKRFKIPSRVGFFIILFFLTAAGGIDVYKYAIAPVNGWKEYSTEEIELANRISLETPVDAIFLTTRKHNHPVYLSGRKTLMGHPFHLWSHGYTGKTKRAEDILYMMSGKLGAIPIIESYRLHYAVVGPPEKDMYVNRFFFSRNYECIISTKNYSVYDLKKKKQSITLSNEFSQEGDKDTAPHSAFEQKKGFYACYYNNMEWKGKPIHEAIEPTIEFQWNHEYEKPVRSPFSILWKGYIDIHRLGTYTFTVTSDDGSWLYVDDILVVDNGGIHAKKSVSGTISLEKGKHKIMIKYFDKKGGAIMRLMWTPPGEKESPVPTRIISYKHDE